MSKIPQDYIERCYAGWLGKVIGVRHGAPIEGWTYEKIAKLMGEITDYPVDYRDFAADDDTNGPLFFLRALEDYTHTREITPEQIGLTWLNYAAYEHGFYWWGGYGRSTEHTAYLNLRAGIPAPRSGSVAQNGAAVAEQIGGQIFIDSWGLAIPGDPDLAAEYAGKAASVSHGGNAIYGGQVVAAAISEAFVSRDIRAVLERAFQTIPGDCEYMRMARDILAFYDQNHAQGWRACMEHITRNWGYDRYPGACHIIPNCAVMIMSMLYGQGRFDDTINICNMAGWDTDCNVGNVGAILGVLVGLEGIDFERWRAPVGDFLAASSVVGCLNIMNLPQNVRQLAGLAYRIRGEQPPERWRAFIDQEHTFDFALPGSTCAFRLRGEGKTDTDRVYHEDEVIDSGIGGLRALLRHTEAGQDRYLYHRTYYRPRHFHDSRYDPAFSPILYPGQEIRARLSCGQGPGLRACLYALDGNSGAEYTGEAVDLMPGRFDTLRLSLPALSGACIEEAGVKVTVISGGGEAVLYLDHLDFLGQADYTLDFAAERMELWGGLHREVSQMTYLKGIWDLEGPRLMGTCADYGEAYTGDIAWGDQEVTCTWTPDASRGDTGFALRVQGAIRGYAVWVSGGRISLEKNENGYTPLAEGLLPEGFGETLTLTARAKGDLIEVLHEGVVLLSARDAKAPYLTGMVGLVVRRGGHAHYEKVAVRVL